MASDDKITLTAPVEGDYKGHPTISIPTGKSGKPFTMGVTKAHAVLKWLEAVKQFATKHAAAPADDAVDMSAIAATLGITEAEARKRFCK